MSRLCVLLFRENLHCEQQQLKLRFQLSLSVAMLKLSFFDPYFLLQLWLCAALAASPPQLLMPQFHALRDHGNDVRSSSAWFPRFVDYYFQA